MRRLAGSWIGGVLFDALTLSRPVGAAEPLTAIDIDWATYNPVSMLLKHTGLLEQAFAKEGVAIRRVQTLGSNKALEFLNAGSLDFGSTAGAAALVGRINGNPIKSIYHSCAQCSRQSALALGWG
jgi:sulfonate transport system substrate-binding protein